MTGESEREEEAPASRHALRRVLLGAVVLLAAGLGLYYGVGMLLIQAIDDDPDFAAADPAPGASRTVALAAALIEREVDTHRWVASDPFFLPGALLDDMPNFQTGIVAALARVVAGLGDQAARPGGKGKSDPDLDRAAGLLKYPGSTWIVDIGAGFQPTASAQGQYRTARKTLLAYNDRLLAQKAVFEPRADALLAILDRVGADIDAAVTALDRQVAGSSGNLLDFAADDVFYAVKGRLYAYALLLRELGRDGQAAIGEHDAGEAWSRMLTALREAAALRPWIVVNGGPDSMLLPSHLVALGYYTARARLRLTQAADLLRK